MEYPLKLSEIIAGCESGSWLMGAQFESDTGSIIILNGYNFDIIGKLDNQVNWRFTYYVY